MASRTPVSSILPEPCCDDSPSDERPYKRLKSSDLNPEIVQAAIQVLWKRIFDGGQRRMASRIQQHICQTTGRLNTDVVVHACVGRGKTTMTAIPFLHEMYMYRNGLTAAKPRALVVCETANGPSLERFYKELGFRTLRIDGFEPLTPMHKSVALNRNFWKNMSPEDLRDLDVFILPDSMNLHMSGVSSENGAVLRKAWHYECPGNGYKIRVQVLKNFLRRLLNSDRYNCEAETCSNYLKEFDEKLASRDCYAIYALFNKIFGCNDKYSDIDVATLYNVVYYVVSQRGMWTMNPVLMNFDASVVILDEWVRNNSYYSNWSKSMYPGCQMIIGTATLNPFCNKSSTPSVFKFVREDIYDDVETCNGKSLCDIVNETEETEEREEFGTGFLNTAVHWNCSSAPCLASQFRTVVDYLNHFGNIKNTDEIIFDTKISDQNIPTDVYFLNKAQQLELHRLRSITPDGEFDIKYENDFSTHRRITDVGKFDWKGLVPWVDGTTEDGDVRADGSTELGEFLNSWIREHIISDEDGVLIREQGEYWLRSIVTSKWYAKTGEQRLNVGDDQFPYRYVKCMELVHPHDAIMDSMKQYRDCQDYDIDPTKIALIAIAARTVRMVLERFVILQVDSAWKEDQRCCDFWYMVSDVSHAATASQSHSNTTQFTLDVATKVAKLILNFSSGEIDCCNDESVIDTQLIEHMKQYDQLSPHVASFLKTKFPNVDLDQPLPNENDLDLWEMLIKFNNGLNEYVQNNRWLSCTEAARLSHVLGKIMKHKGDACTKTICRYILRSIQTTQRKNKSSMSMRVYELFVPAYVRLINKVKERNASSTCAVAMHPSCVFSKYIIWRLENQQCNPCTYDLTSLDMMTDIVVFGDLTQNTVFRQVFTNNHLLSHIRKFVFNANWYMNMTTTKNKSTRLKDMEKKVQNDMKTASTVCILSSHMKKGSNVIAEPGSHMVMMTEQMENSDVIQFSGRNTRFVQEKSSYLNSTTVPSPTHIHFVQESLETMLYTLRKYSLSFDSTPTGDRHSIPRMSVCISGLTCRRALLMADSNKELSTSNANFIPNFVGRGGNLVTLGNENVIDSTQFLTKRVVEILESLTSCNDDLKTIRTLEEELHDIDKNTMWELSHERLEMLEECKSRAKIQLHKRMQENKMLTSDSKTIATVNDPDAWAWDVIQKCKRNCSTRPFGMLTHMTFARIGA